VTRRSEEEFTVPCSPPDEALDKTLKDLEQRNRKNPKMKLQVQYESPKVGKAPRKGSVPEDNDRVTPVVAMPEAMETLRGIGGREKREKPEKKEPPHEPAGIHGHHQEGKGEPRSKWAYAVLAGAFVVMVCASVFMFYTYQSTAGSTREAKKPVASASATPTGSTTPTARAGSEVAPPSPIASMAPVASNASAGSNSASIPLAPPIPIPAVSAPWGHANAPPKLRKPPTGVVKPKGPAREVVEGSKVPSEKSAGMFGTMIEENNK